jgi:glyoxylase-like metal-dependent hydrolase (beta-lactamase superfamily II)
MVGVRKMNIKVIPFTKGISRSYIVKGHNYILVDTGMNISRERYLNIFKKLSIDPKEIKLIVITHGHTDHFAGIHILKQLTKADILCHRKAEEPLRTGINKDLKARNWVGKLGKSLFNMNLKEYVPVKASILIEDDYDLSTYGISGKVICTPGHTDCSISVILQSKVLLSGDLIVGSSHNPALSPFASSEEELIQSLKKIICMDVEYNYCGHGGPHQRKDIINLIEKYV